jgi:hypothetical protein
MFYVLVSNGLRISSSFIQGMNKIERNNKTNTIMTIQIKPTLLAQSVLVRQWNVIMTMLKMIIYLTSIVWPIKVDRNEPFLC